MKLTAARVERTLKGFDAQAIPDNHPVVPKLNQLFGDHTFFLNADGLHIVEPVSTANDAGQSGIVIEVASWTDGTRTSLAPHEPAPTELVIPLDGDEPGSRH